MNKTMSLVSCSVLLMLSAATLFAQTKSSGEPKAWPHGPYDKLTPPDTAPAVISTQNSTSPPASKPPDAASLPFRDAEKALQKAFEYIDANQIRYKNAPLTRQDVEPLSVSYDFDRPDKLISVDFRVKSAVKSNYFEVVWGTLSVNLDERGQLLSQFSGERRGSPPTKQWKVSPSSSGQE